MRKKKEHKPVFQKMMLKRVGVLSCGKILGLLYFFAGIIVGLIFFFFALVGAMAAPAEALVGVMVSLLFIIFLPVLYGGMGFVAGLIFGLLYNLITQYFGGLEMEYKLIQ
jgi:hypothetical protein